MRELHCGRFRLSLQRPLLMGIVNVTPDSFSDGGHYMDFAHALEHALRLIEEGADILDVGGESTRPGATPVATETELARVIPLIQKLADCAVPISVDTSKPEVMRAALEAGASMINDVNALQAHGALEIAANSQVGICLMHRQGDTQTMQATPHYGDVVIEVRDFLARRVAACENSGIAKNRITTDPGVGFGKRLSHNLALLRSLKSLNIEGTATLIGASRKSWIGELTGSPVESRLGASVAAACYALQHGAHIARVHDVKATKDALTVLEALDA